MGSIDGVVFHRRHGAAQAFEGGGTGAHVEEQAVRHRMILRQRHHHAVKAFAHREAGVVADDGLRQCPAVLRQSGDGDQFTAGTTQACQLQDAATVRLADIAGRVVRVERRVFVEIEHPVERFGARIVGLGEVAIADLLERRRGQPLAVALHVVGHGRTVACEDVDLPRRQHSKTLRLQRCDCRGIGDLVQGADENSAIGKTRGEIVAHRRDRVAIEQRHRIGRIEPVVDLNLMVKAAHPDQRRAQADQHPHRFLQQGRGDEIAGLVDGIVDIGAGRAADVAVRRFASVVQRQRKGAAGDLEGFDSHCQITHEVAHRHLVEKLNEGFDLTRVVFYPVRLIEWQHSEPVHDAAPRWHSTRRSLRPVSNGRSLRTRLTEAVAWRAASKLRTD